MATIRKRGTHQYQARIRVTGHPPLSKTFSTRKDALSWANDLEKLVMSGHGDAIRAAERLTLHDALERYFIDISAFKKSHSQEARRIRYWQKNPLSELAISQLRASHLAVYRDARINHGISGATLRLEFALLSHLFEVARKDWGFETLNNPIKALRKPKVNRGRNRRLLENEETLLLDHCHQSENTRLAALIILAIETAMRRGEIVSLKWNDVDLDMRTAYLDDTKNGDSRTIPLSTRAIAAFNLIPKRSDTLVANMHPDTITWEFTKACKACDIKGLRFHDLRHEATSRLFEKGFNTMEVSTITGHKTLSMLKRYTHLRPSDLLSRLG